MFDPAEKSALRRCALLCWTNRKQLGLSVAESTEVLIAFRAVGSIEEAEAADRVIAARRAEEERQQTFDQLLTDKPALPPAQNGNGQSPA